MPKAQPAGGDNALLSVLKARSKLSPVEAAYDARGGKAKVRCGGCKFFFSVEKQCFVVHGDIAAKGVCKFFTDCETGLLPGDVVWEYVRDTGSKLNWKEALVLKEGDKGFQCGDCKFYLYSRQCLIVKTKFKPGMTCAYIVKVGEGTPL